MFIKSLPLYKQYLRSVRPLVDDSEYSHLEDLAKEFESTIGSKLQRYLTLKSWWSTNYVSDWWEEYVYLRGRGPLMINSNFYGIDAIYMQTTNVQAARAAHITSLLLIFRRTVERQELQPVSDNKIFSCDNTMPITSTIVFLFYLFFQDHGARTYSFMFMAI